MTLYSTGMAQVGSRRRVERRQAGVVMALKAVFVGATMGATWNCA